MKKILPLFSYLFHPIFIPVLGTLAFLLWGNAYFETRLQFLMLLQIVIITILIPMSFIYLLKTLGRVDSVMISEISQRKLPLLVQLVLMIILLTQSITIDRIPELFFFFLGGLTSTLFTLLLLFARIKASLHMIGISALTVFLIGLSLHNHTNLLWAIAVFIGINGLIASSRLAMKAHDFRELAIGLCAGIIPQIVLLACWL